MMLAAGLMLGLVAVRAPSSATEPEWYAGPLMIGADGGLSRVLDKRTRTYSVHLDIDDDGVFATSDYDFELRPYEPKHDKKAPAGSESGKPPPGSYTLRLTDLRWKAGDLSHREATFGSGLLVFPEQGFPSAFLTGNWILSPLLGFYAPGADAASLADLPISGAAVGVGWTLTGKARLEASTAAGQPMSLVGTLRGGGGPDYQLAANSVFDPKTGWPKECHGTITRGTLTVTYLCRLR